MSDSEAVEHDGTARRSPASANSTPTDSDLAERLAAVEQAVTGEGPVADLSTAAERDSRVEDLTRRLEEAETRLDELEAATQALRGYVGSVRAVNEEVEHRADMALAVAERAERRIDGGEPDAPKNGSDTGDQRAEPAAAPAQSTVGADDADVAAAVGEKGAELDREPTVGEPAVAAAVPDGSEGLGGSGGADSNQTTESGGGVLARLRDVL